MFQGSRKKSRIFYGQADRKRLPSPPPSSYGQLYVKFLCVFFFILDYDFMCSEMDFTPEKLFSSNYKNSQVMMTMKMIMRTSPLLSTEHLTPPTMVGPG